MEQDDFVFNKTEMTNWQDGLYGLFVDFKKEMIGESFL